ncbi:MAG: hypothetical protein K6E47_14430 [Lachnospiraceae bacterium]|nr:hypothetical protein [Lachnospiraceae bacterium]
MRLIYRFLAGIVLMAMVISVFPAGFIEAASSQEKVLSMKKTKKVLYLGGCEGTTAEGKKAKYYDYVSVRKLIDGFDPKEYNITLKSGSLKVATVDSKEDKIYAAGLGKTTVTVTVKSKADKKKVLKAKLMITVKKNADYDSFTVAGIKDGQTVYEGDRLIVEMPGDYTDKRTLFCDDEEAIDVTSKEDGYSFEVIFLEYGEYILTAAAYQSETYSGYTVIKEFDITVKEKEAEIVQTSSDSIKLIGGPVDEDMEAADFTLYELNNGICMFFSYASSLSVDGDEASITFFELLDSEKEYELEYDGLTYRFISGQCKASDVDSFSIAETEVRAGEETKLTYKYFNKNGLDITKSVASELYGFTEASLGEKEYYKGFVSNGKIFLSETGEEVKVTASLKLGQKDDGTFEKVLSTETVIKALPKKGTQLTGKAIFTVKPEGDTYLQYGDKTQNEVPVSDSVVIEALFEMDDGSYKNFKTAGITRIVSSDPTVSLIGTEASKGGYKLLLNNEGETSIIAFRGEEAVGSFDITVLPARKASELKVELSKDHLNTNLLTEDYVLVKADMYDQYGAPIVCGDYKLEQTEYSKKDIGEIKISEIAKGRFIINGWECPSVKEQKVIMATLSCDGLSHDVRIFILDVPYDSSGLKGYSYSLKADGSRVIDTAIHMAKEPPKSTFVTVEISKDGYYVGEGTGTIFNGPPLAIENASSLGIDPGSCFYGISVEYTSPDGIKTYLSENDCIIPSYMELEFVPYTYGSQLDPGTYEIRGYRIIAEDKNLQIEIFDSMTITAIDTEPEIEVVQLSQSYKEKPEDGWESEIADYFSFKLDGEDISEYITKVDSVESSIGTVYVGSVEFEIPNPYYGAFTKTAEVGRLITKQ